MCFFNVTVLLKGCKNGAFIFWKLLKLFVWELQTSYQNPGKDYHNKIYWGYRTANRFF